MVQAGVKFRLLLATKLSGVPGSCQRKWPQYSTTPPMAKSDPSNSGKRRLTSARKSRCARFYARALFCSCQSDLSCCYIICRKTALRNLSGNQSEVYVHQLTGDRMRTSTVNKIDGWASFTLEQIISLFNISIENCVLFFLIFVKAEVS